VLRDDRGNDRQVRRGIENGVDCPVEMGRNRRPYPLDRAAGRRVELVKRVSGLDAFDDLAWGHERGSDKSDGGRSAVDIIRD
jgi:hypothetical protein